MPPGKFSKITPSEIESGDHLSTFDAPVDTGTQNFFKCIICMPIHAGYVMLQKLLYIKIVMLVSLKLLLSALMLVYFYGENIQKVHM